MTEVEDLQYMPLWNGVKMAAVSFGTYFGPVLDPQTIRGDQVKALVLSAIDAGYRHIDTAWSYKTEREIGEAVREKNAGYRHIDTAWSYKTEREIGEAVREKIQEGVIAREDMFITTKLSLAHHDPAFVKDCLKASLRELGMDYVDMYLIHCPVAFEQIGVEQQPKWDGTALLDNNNDHLKTWKALEECVRAGLARSIGVSNFNLKQVCHIVDHAEIQPAVNQVEIHPYLTQQTLVDGCKVNKLRVQAYTPLGQGHHTWASDSPSPLQDPVIKQIASRYNKTPAQVILRYQLQRGVAVAIRSSNHARIKENIQIFDFQLTNDDMETLAKLNKDARLGYYKYLVGHKDYPFDE